MCLHFLYILNYFGHLGRQEICRNETKRNHGSLGIYYDIMYYVLHIINSYLPTYYSRYGTTITQLLD